MYGGMCEGKNGLEFGVEEVLAIVDRKYERDGPRYELFGDRAFKAAGQPAEQKRISSNGVGDASAQ